MRIGILSSYDAEGGAGKAAYRLHQALLESGADSGLYALFKGTDDITVTTGPGKVSKYTSLLRTDIERVPLLFYPRRQKKFFTTSFLRNAAVVRWANQKDVVNIHWVAAGFLGIQSISQITKPIVLTMHDSWGFTGGCHVPGTCTNYLDRCGRCPQLGSGSENDLSSHIFRQKLRAWRDKKFTVVTDGRWLADRARDSKLFSSLDIRTVNPGLALDVFKPMDRKQARERLNIRPDAKVILFGAMGAMSDENKGYVQLEAALRLLEKDMAGEPVEVAIFGATRPRVPENHVFKTHYLGVLKDSLSLPIVYSAADVMVVPSLQEAFGQTASESLACGTPVVAFDATGLKDSVDHLENGFLAPPYEPRGLSEGISWVLSDPVRWQNLSRNARQKAERCFGLPRYAEKYLEIYKASIEQSRLPA